MTTFARPDGPAHPPARGRPDPHVDPPAHTAGVGIDRHLFCPDKCIDMTKFAVSGRDTKKKKKLSRRGKDHYGRVCLDKDNVSSTILSG